MDFVERVVNGNDKLKSSSNKIPNEHIADKFEADFNLNFP